MQCLSADDHFFQELFEMDKVVFLEVKSQGCLKCYGKLDIANFKRKPRGLGEKQEIRLSLCCRVTGCRSRVTTPSLRFLGRKVYIGWVVIMAIDFYSQLGLSSLISRKTIARWRRYWSDRFHCKNIFMRKASSFLPPDFHSNVNVSIASLVSLFNFPAKDSWVFILKFFAD